MGGGGGGGLQNNTDLNFSFLEPLVKTKFRGPK